MPRAKTDKSRKDKVEQFKTKQKQKNKPMPEAPKFKPFRQVPHWEPDSKIELTGQQFATLKDFFNIFSEPIHVMQDIFSANLDKGNIVVKYVDNENNEIPADDVKAYMLELKDYIATQAEVSGGSVLPDINPEEPKPPVELKAV